MSKYYEEMIVFDSCYEICKAIIEKLGGTNQDWESVYQEVKYIAELVGVDTTQREYLSVYDILIDVIETLGGEDGELDSVYDQVVYIAELSGIEPKSYDATYYALLDIYESGGTGGCEKVLPIHFAVVKDISTYTDRIYDNVYDKATDSWYSLNNLNEYEEYGVMETVEALSATTSYPGKLVILSGSSTPHEYEYNNGWNDLGEMDIKYAGEFDGNSYFDTGLYAKNNMCVEYVATYYKTESANPKGGPVYGSRRGSSGAVYSHGGFATSDTQLNVDLGSQRTASNVNYVNKEINMKAWLYTSGTTNTNVKYGIESTLDGEPFINATGTTTGANYDANGNGRNMYIGTMNSNGSPIAYDFNGLLKSIKISENIDATGTGTLTHDYTFKEVDGVVKMYDEVTETYFPNKGSGSVVLVPVWTPIKEYEEKDAPITKYVADTYCDLYDIDDTLAYIGLKGEVEGDRYFINDEAQWEYQETPVIEYDGIIFTALEDGSAIAMTNVGSNTPQLQISYDGEEWETWDYSEIDLNEGEQVAFRGTSLSSTSGKYSKFVMAGSIDVKGNFISLLDGGACSATTISRSYAFVNLFSGCTALQNAGESSLPVTLTSSSNNCCGKMFFKCTNLKTAPSLPSSATSNYCYEYMFQGCSNLEEAPELPAEKMNGDPYQYMLQGCSKINYVWVMAERNPGSGWLGNTASAGTIVKSTKGFWTNEPNTWTKEYSGQTEVSVSAITFASGTSAYSLYVQTDSYGDNTWEITEYPAWCTLSTTTGAAGRTIITVTPQANNDDPRSGNIVIEATDNRTFTIPVYQDGYAFEWENLYSQYSGTDRYWYVQYDESATTISLTLGNNSKTWEITACPEWCTLSTTAGTGSTNIIVSATPNTETNYREGIITAQSGSRSVNFRVMQYKYPVVLANNLGNRAHSASDDNEPKVQDNSWFTFDIAVSGEVTPSAYDFVGMKSIVQRTDGSSWRTNPTVYIDTQWERQKRPTITKFEIDASTIIQMEQAFTTGKGMYPNCTSFTITNCENMTKGLGLAGLLSAVSISVGDLPAVSSTQGTSFPATTTLTDLSIGSLYANKNVILSGCTNLTVTSLVNVLNALPDNTGTSYSQTCVLGSTNTAKLTTEQIAIATDKGWAVT